MLCKKLLCKMKKFNSMGNKAVFNPLLFVKLDFCEYFIYTCIALWIALYLINLLVMTLDLVLCCCLISYICRVKHLHKSITNFFRFLSLNEYRCSYSILNTRPYLKKGFGYKKITKKFYKFLVIFYVNFY